MLRAGAVATGRGPWCVAHLPAETLAGYRQRDPLGQGARSLRGGGLPQRATSAGGGEQRARPGEQREAIALGCKLPGVLAARALLMGGDVGEELKGLKH
jgi:hypothetical protein